MKVVKFGGSSLASGPQAAKAAAIMRADPARRVMVVSAPGKRFAGDEKVTDLLLQLAEAWRTDREPALLEGQILGRYRSIADHFGLPGSRWAERFRDHLRTVATAAYPNQEYYLAALMAQGEWLNAHLLAAVLNQCGVPARYGSPQDLGLVVSGPPRQARLTPASYAQLARYPLPPDQVLVVPGFFAYDAQGRLATFARGGSDVTGSILARGFGAALYENFTDVSAVYAADPRIIPHPRAINTLTYREMRELACAGFAVFNDDAVLPAIQGQIPIAVKNTNVPEAPGTRIVPEKVLNAHHLITGIAVSGQHTALYLHRYRLNQDARLPLQVLQILAQHHLSYEQMPAGADDLTIVLPQAQAGPPVRAALSQALTAAIQPDDLRWLPDLALVTVVGEGLAHRTDLVAAILQRLALVEITPLLMTQGAARVALTLGVAPTQATAAVQAIYALSAEEEQTERKGTP